MITLAMIIVLSYLVGSIPTSIIAARILRGIDIREYGSGNAGATNTFRVLGPGPGIFVMLADIAKGATVVLLVTRIAFDPLPWGPELVRIFAGVAAIFGHVWTVFAGFRGGKGVGTAAGVLIALAPTAAVICIGVWVILTLSTRYVSVGSISAAIMLPVTLMVQKFVLEGKISDSILVFSILTAFLIVATHRSNIARLIRGEENRFGGRRSNREEER